MQLVPLNGVTVTTTSDPSKSNVENLIALSVQFTCTGHTSGNGVFSVDVSNDGVNWATSIALIDAASTTPSTRVTSVTLNSNSSKMYYFGNDFGAKLVRVVCAVTTDGVYTAVIQGQPALSH